MKVAIGWDFFLCSSHLCDSKDCDSTLTGLAFLAVPSGIVYWIDNNCVLIILTKESS